MTQAFQLLSGTNGFIPQATGQLINYVRTPDEFPLNKYVQLVESPNPVGIYFVIDHDQPIRLSPNGQSFAFADGAERPHGEWNQLGFKEVPFTCNRWDFPFVLGNQANRTNVWKAFEQSMGMVASQAMTWRTNQVIGALQTTSNWPSTNIGDANTLNNGAGTWDKASDDPTSANYNAIKKTLMQVMTTIHLQTNAKLRVGDLQLILSPNQAQKMAVTSEIHSYMKYTQAPMLIQGEGVWNPNENFGLPKYLYGFEVVIENSPILSDIKQQAQTVNSPNRAFIKNDTMALVTSRVGGIDGAYGAPNFSTVQLYWYEYQMSVWSYADPRNLRTEGHVMDNYQVVLPAPESGFCIQNVM